MTMKLSFTKSSSSKPKHQQNAFNGGSSVSRDASSVATEKQFVTEFDPSKTLASNQRSHRLVIPPKENEWRPLKKMKNLELPLGSTDDDGIALQFEVATDTIGNGEGSNMSFGLNLRNSLKDDAAVGDVGQSKPSSIETLMMQKFKEDMNNLPDSVMEDYDEMPVEGFGAALLAGYGWFEGRGIGKNAKGDVDIVEYKRWTGKEGLGFQSAEIVNKREKQDGAEYKVGQEIRIIEGRDAGTIGKVVEIANDGKSVVLRLPKINEEVKMQIGGIAHLGSAEEDKCLKKLKESKDENGRSYKESSREVEKTRVDDKNQSRRSGEGEERRRRSSYQREEEPKKKSSTSSSSPRRSSSWLTSHIRVRVISKKLKGGRVYLKKGKVLDVVGPTTCDISMDETGEILQGVDQVVLETALPRRGGQVLVLYGKHKGVYGSLIEKDSENERGVVRDADSHGLVNVRLEQIAEFIGDPESLGY